MSLFGRNKQVETKFEVVPVEGPRLPEMTPELREAIWSLSHHPGFQYLATKLRTQKALLLKTLQEGRHTDIRDVDFIQGGIFWTGWLDNQLNSHQPKTPPTNASPDEIQAFEEIRDAVELVGQ